MADRDTSLAKWLVTAGADGMPISELHGRFCDKLHDGGLPLWRSNLIVQMLNPQLGGSGFTWREGELAHEDVEGVGAAMLPAARPAGYADSPMRIVEETGRRFRRRLDRPLPDLPLLDDFRRQGASDYVIFPLPFLDRGRRSALSFATRTPDGFTERDVGDLEFACRLFSPYAERHVLRRNAVDLLETYIGHNAGERVFAGHIQRGAAETIHAAIWLCDLRDFTRHSNAVATAAVIEMLNAWYDCVGEAIDAAGGEILKFMGDGVLAIFPAGDDPGLACERALAAMRASTKPMAELNRLREADGDPHLSSALALHLGTVSFGNVGTRRRLDFTVIGPAVNLTSRVLELAKSSGNPVLMTSDFAANTRGRRRSLGRVALRGFDRPVEVFVPESDDLSKTHG